MSSCKISVKPADELQETTLSDKEIKNYKVVLVGDGGTGKSSFVDRLNYGGYRKEYIATLGIEKHTIIVETSVGNIEVTLHDTAGQEKFGPLRDDYYKDIDAAILFFDVTSRVTYKNVPQWHKDITRVCSNVPVSLCANKIDISPSLRKVKAKSILYHTKHDEMRLFEISVKEKIGLREPLEFLLQQLLKDSSLKIIGSLGTLIYDIFGNLNLR